MQTDRQIERNADRQKEMQTDREKLRQRDLDDLESAAVNLQCKFNIF